MKHPARVSMRTVAIGLLACACKSGQEAPPSPAGSPSAPTPAASATSDARSPMLSAEAVAKEVNPEGVAPYSGPTATLRGRVRIEGEPAPSAKFTFKPVCGEAAATYGKLFRVGLDGGVADALVAVTGPTGTYVPAKSESVELAIKGCALSQRTIALTYGQRLDIKNRDGREAYMPALEGAEGKAVMVAVPQGEAVQLIPPQPGRYLLVDKLDHDFLRADVFVVRFSTHDVTDLNGSYEIAGIPVGKVRVNAYLPATGSTVERMLEIKEGEITLDLALKYPASPGAAGSSTKAPAAR